MSVAVRLMVPVVGGLGDLTVERRHVINPAFLATCQSAFPRASCSARLVARQSSQKVRGCLLLGVCERFAALAADGLEGLRASRAGDSGKWATLTQGQPP